MSVRTWCSWLAACALFASCEPRTVEIEGLDELTAEIRSQRLLNRQQAATSGGSVNAGSAAQVGGAQIQLAMAPLRDVLTQLGTSQRELSARQATLTQEMRRWTQLLVQSMHDERSDEATKLGERLAELEKTISKQDKRHRKVEELLGSALDHTADQLEKFLRQVGADTGTGSSGTDSSSAVGPSTGGPAAPSTGGPVAPSKGGPATASAEGPESGGPPTPAGTTSNDDGRADPTTGSNDTGPNKGGGTPAPVGTGATAATENAAAGRQPAESMPPRSSESRGADGKQDSQEGSMAWLWGLAVMSLLSGLVLLFGKKRSRPLAMAPEMQYAPHQQPTDDVQPTSPTFTETNAAPADLAVADLAVNVQVIGDLALGNLTTGDLAVGNSAIEALAVGALAPDEQAPGDLAMGDQIGNDSPPGNSQHDDYPNDNSPNDSGKPDSAQIEELWAAAALLGEAIGRLKQTDEPIPPEFDGQQPLPEIPISDHEQTKALTADTLPSHTDSNEFDDIFIIDDDDEADATIFAEPCSLPSQASLDGPTRELTTAIGTEFDAVQALGLPNPDRAAEASEPTSAADASAATHSQAHDTDADGIKADAAATDGAEPAVTSDKLLDPSLARTPVDQPTVVAAPSQHLTIPPASGQPAARHASSSPITCRLQLSGDEQAEGRVRSILGRDPRVLVSPAPQVRTGMGELEVSFALLPGLTAGERSLLEQQLRDTVA